MLIGRADAGESPRVPTVEPGRSLVWDLCADAIWASGRVPPQQAGHMTAFAPSRLLSLKPLALGGPSTHGTHVT